MRKGRRGRVLVLGPMPPPTHGAAVVTAGVLEWLRGTGATVEVVDSSANSHGSEAIRGLAEITRYLFARIWAHGTCCIALLTRRPDVMYVTAAGARGLLLQMPCICLARMLDVPVILHHHSGAYLAKRSTLMSLVCRMMSAESTHLVLGTKMKDQLRRMYASRNVEVLSNALFVTGQDPLSKSSSVSNRVRLGHISNLSVAKGMREVQQTVAKLEASHRAFELHIAGPVADAETQEILDDLQRNRPHVHVYGAVRGAALWNFYDRLDVLLFPSRYRHEAAPMVVLEAASRWVPTLAYQVGTLPELVCSSTLLAPLGQFAERADSLVDAWPGVGTELSALTYASFRRDRGTAERRMHRIWHRYLRGNSPVDPMSLTGQGMPNNSFDA